MPAPTITIPTDGTAPNQYSNLENLHNQVNAAFAEQQVELDTKASTALLPTAVSQVSQAPIAAIGGDVVVWHDGMGIDFAPSPKFIEAMSAALNPPEAIVKSVTGGETLRRTRAKIAALRKGVAATQFKVLMVGDSWAAGVPLVTELRNVLASTYEMAGDGFISANNLNATQTGATYALTGGWVLIDGSLEAMTYGVTPDGQMRWTNLATDTATWSNIRCTRFSVYVRQQGGTWRWRVDGGAWTTVTDDASGSLKRVQITGLTDAVHTIEINTTGNTGIVALAGFYMEREGVSGIVISRFADGGNTGLGMTPYLPAQSDVLAHEPPDLILTILGTNDARGGTTTTATYVSYMTQLVTAARAGLSDVDVIHLIPPQNGMPFVRPLTDYRDAISAALPVLRTEYLSLSERYGTYAESNALGLWLDLLHPNHTGARMIANLLNDHLIRI